MADTAQKVSAKQESALAFGKKERKLCSPKAGFIFSATRMNTREGEEENNK